MPVPAAVSPIDPAQSQAISAARQAQRRFSFAIKLARWNGVSLLLAAAISLLLGLFDSGLLLAAAWRAASGWMDVKEAGTLETSEPRALLWLPANQLLLMAAITI